MLKLNTKQAVPKYMRISASALKKAIDETNAAAQNQRYQKSARDAAQALADRMQAHYDATFGAAPPAEPQPEKQAPAMQGQDLSDALRDARQKLRQACDSAWLKKAKQAKAHTDPARLVKYVDGSIGKRKVSVYAIADALAAYAGTIGVAPSDVKLRDFMSIGGGGQGMPDGAAQVWALVLHTGKQ